MNEYPQTHAETHARMHAYNAPATHAQVCATVTSAGAPDAARAEAAGSLFRAAAAAAAAGPVLGTQRGGALAGAGRLALPAMTTLEQMRAEIARSPAKAR